MQTMDFHFLNFLWPHDHDPKLCFFKELVVDMNPWMVVLSNFAENVFLETVTCKKINQVGDIKDL